MEPRKRRYRLPWPELLLSLGATLVFFLLLEGGLALAGIEPHLQQSDPFVGFASTAPLFVPESETADTEILVTSPAKTSFFNRQRLSHRKSPGSFRIFCLGGSTTYGRPYDDRTSFPGWLREMLEAADPQTHWEVVNAGGISYASYRIAELMTELRLYDPDLFIIYTGHNEFLEERTYGELKDLPDAVKVTVGRLAQTRTWAALSTVLDQMKVTRTDAEDDRTILPDRVSAKLDRAAGLDLYERDDELGNRIVNHFRLSLKRMIELARAAGAEVILVTPAANLKDFSPFKSQHTDGMTAADRARSEELLREILGHAHENRWAESLATAELAIELDSRYADLHYHRGRALFELGRFDEAKASLTRALEEDVCPLRALPDIKEAVREVARELDVALVDFVELLDARLVSSGRPPIAGQEFFVDHVHPTVDGNKLLALHLIEQMQTMGIVDVSDDWGEAAIRRVESRVESRLTPDYQAQALAKLALTLDWAGKKNLSRDLALEALALGTDDPLVRLMIARHSAMAGETEEALGHLRAALVADPRNPSTHEQLGLLLMGEKQLEAAAAHVFMAAILEANNAQLFRYLGFIQSQRGRPAEALQSYRKARRLDPDHAGTQTTISGLEARVGLDAAASPPTQNGITSYPDGAWKSVSQVRPTGTGNYDIDGIRTEWYPDGRLARFSDYRDGVLDGVDVAWDRDGRLMEQGRYRDGVAIEVDSRLSEQQSH